MTNSVTSLIIYSIVATGLLAGMATQSIWNNNNHHTKWLLICILNIILVYLIGKKTLGFSSIFLKAFPLCRLILSILFKFLFLLIQAIFKSKFKTRKQNFITHVILGRFKPIYDRNLLNPTTIDYVFSYGHLILLLFFLGKLYRFFLCLQT